MRNPQRALLPLLALLFLASPAIAQTENATSEKLENETPFAPNPALKEKDEEDEVTRPSPGEIEQKILDRARSSLGELEPGADVAYGYFQRGLYLSALAAATDLAEAGDGAAQALICLLYTSPSPRD